MADFSINVKVNGVEQSVSTIGELEDALKATNDELANLSIGSAEFNELSKQARVLDSNLKNIAVSLEGADTKKLAESFAKLGETIGGAFAIATSAVSLFGGEAEDVALAQARAQQAIAIVLGARAIAEGVVEGAAAARLIVDKVSVVTTGLLTAAIGAETVATAAQAAATGTATVAQLALNAAMKAAPYAIIISALAGLAALIIDTGEGTEEYTEALKRNTDEINSNAKALETSIDLLRQRTEVQIETARIQGEINALEADNAKERLDIIGKSEEEIAKIKTDALEKEIQDRQKEFGPRLREVILNVYGVLTEDQKTLNRQLLSENQQTQQQAEKQITEIIASISDVSKAYRENAKIEDEELNTQRAERLEAIQTFIENNFKALVSARNQLVILNKQRILDEKQTNEEIEKNNRDLAKKRAEDYKSFVQEAKSQLKSLRDQERQLSREIEDIILNRSAKEDDVVAQAILNIEKVKVARERELEDNRRSLQQEIDDFVKAGREKKISKEKIDAEVAKLTERGRVIQKSINDKYDLLEIQAVEDKNKLITEIDESLAREQSFGGFNLLDSKKKLLQEELEFNQDIAERKKLIDDDYWRFIVAKQPERIAQATAAQRAIIEAEREAKLQQLEIDLQNDLIQIQGTEEQKNEQKKNLENQYLEEKKRINEDANTKIAETEIEIAKKTTQEKIELAQIGIGFATQGLQAFNNLSQALTNSQLKRVKDNAEAEEKIRQKAFKRQKALNIVGAVINGAQAVLQAIAQFGPPPSPLGIAGIAAAGILTASQIALIASQQYSGADTGSTSTGGGSVPDVSTPGASVTQPVFGGFTGFNQNLVGTPTTGGGQTTPFTSGGSQMYVLESDITNTQNRVRVLESGASFG